MRITTVAIALLLGASAPAFADARILLMQDKAETPAQEEVAGQQVAPAPPEPAPPMQAPPAASPPTPPLAPRFSFERAKDGFLRLDKETGQIAYCASRAAGWACEAVPEERAALEKEIARLQDEVAGLKRDLAALREPPPPPRPPADLAPRPPTAKEGDVVIKLPTQEDIDRATAALQRAWDRVVDMIGNLAKDLTRKGQPDKTTL